MKRDWLEFIHLNKGAMRSQNQHLNRKKELLGSSNRKRRKDLERQFYLDMTFPLEKSRESEETLKGIKEYFFSSIREESEIFKKQRLKRYLFWLFVEYFFDSSNIPLKEFMGKIEKNIILITLYKASGDQRQAADILGLKYTTLNEKIKKYQIRVRK